MEGGVIAALFQQFGVGALLPDALAVDIGDPVRIADGGEAVGDDQGGASPGQLFQCRLDVGLGDGVQGGGGLIQQQDGRVLE